MFYTNFIKYIKYIYYEFNFKAIEKQLLNNLKNKFEYNFKRLIVNYPKFILFKIIKKYLIKINYF